ncbi:DoxX family protein [Ilumatobacter sp.]|uniref:DoxX family protein n=1 Tax=Ilumatobacter sp. TaxID=1967498 RepID=UPI003C3A2413
MTTVGLVASIAIGAMFIFSGGAKLAGRDDWMRQSADLDVPRWLAQIVPWYELVLGAALLSGLARPWPAIVAVVTLVVFTWFIARRMLDGTRPPCACFGSRSTRPLGRRHLLRNGGLIVVAALGIFAA